MFARLVRFRLHSVGSARATALGQLSLAGLRDGGGGAGSDPTQQS